jgi:hypothetical protein
MQAAMISRWFPFRRFPFSSLTAVRQLRNVATLCVLPTSRQQKIERFFECDTKLLQASNSMSFCLRRETYGEKIKQIQTKIRIMKKPSV